jgi:hypothetical protein
MADAFAAGRIQRLSTARAAIAVLVRPSRFFQSIPGETRFGPPLLVALMATMTAAGIVTVYALIGLVRPSSDGVGSLVAFTVAKMLQLALFDTFIGGAVLHVIARWLGGVGSYRQSVAIAAYSMVVVPITSLIGVIPSPHIGVLPWLYGFYIAATGVIVLHKTAVRRTFIVFGVCGLLTMTLAIVAVNRAAKNHTSEREQRSSVSDAP